MNKRMVLLVGILCASLSVNGERVGRMEGLVQPQGLDVDPVARKIFISEGATIKVYSLSDFAFISAFGREGDGPGEFRKTAFLPLKVTARRDQVVVSGVGKVVLFDPSGSLLKEISTHPGIQGHVPLGEGFVARLFVREGGVKGIAVSFYGGDMSFGNDICRKEGAFQMGPKINPFLGLHEPFQVEGERVYVEDGEGVIRCFDRHGSLLETLPNDYPQHKVIEGDQEAFLCLLKTDPRTRMLGGEQLRHDLAFPEYAPLIRDFRADGGRVYVFPTQTGADGRMTCHVFDAEGRRVRTAPCALKSRNIAELFPFCIRQGHLYQVVEGKDEAWYLHVSEI